MIYFVVSAYYGGNQANVWYCEDAQRTQDYWTLRGIWRRGEKAWSRHAAIRVRVSAPCVIQEFDDTPLWERPIPPEPPPPEPILASEPSMPMPTGGAVIPPPPPFFKDPFGIWMNKEKPRS